MKDAAPLTILHLSDPQFGRNHRFGNLLSLADPDAKFDSLLQRLTDDLDFLKADQGVEPQVVVVSGDLAEWAKKSEFQDALEFLVKLSQHLKLPRRRVVIVPGNHDVNRKLCEAYFNECEGEDKKPLEPYTPKWKHYIWLFEQFYAGEDKISFNPAEPWNLWEFEDLKLVVAGLNSTMKESHKDECHYGWVGEGQLRWFADKLAVYQQVGWFRLGVVHHNQQRGAVDDDENLRDAPNLENRLGPFLNLLLHGHTHDAKMYWIDPSLPVLSTGSAALRKEARPEEVANQYQAICIRPSRIERWTRRYDAKQERWIGDTRSSQNGDKWHVETGVRFKSLQGIFPDVSVRRSDSERTERGRSHGIPPGTPVYGKRGKLTVVDWPEDIQPGESWVDASVFPSRVREVTQLRYRDSLTEIYHVDGQDLDYLHVRAREGPTTRIWPIGISEHGVSVEKFERFRTEVVDQYRTLDPGMQCELVYGGERATDELIHKASSLGIRLVSFVEFQGIIDFSGYVKRQTQKLKSNTVYPSKLYVPQRVIYEIGRDHHEAEDACSAILDWLKDPVGRLILVLGDFGVGKTFLLREIARRMALETPHMVPVLIELRNLEKAHTLDQLIAQHLADSGEQYIDLAAFPYMLREGRIALLFDGFDELVLRVSYQRATEHLETLLKAAEGRAKIVVSCRTQHFESDEQVRTVLFQRTETLPGLRVARVQLFDESQIRRFLSNLLDGDEGKAEERFKLIEDIKDLLGLSHNPRMLSFIAALPEEKLREAKKEKGTITSAELYRLLIDQWLIYEYERAQPKGAQPSLTVAERWHAVMAVALCLWPKIDRTMRLSELTEEVARAVDKLTAKQDKKLDEHAAAHLVGSGTLLVRDETGAFGFVHQSLMEWLVANKAAEQITAGAAPSVLALREMSPLMADFFTNLAGREAAVQWAREVLVAEGLEQPFAKSNGALVLERLSEKAVVLVRMAGADLRGKSFSGQMLEGADFSGADLTEARFEGADLTGADLNNAVLERADFARANLSRANLKGVRAFGANFLGADLRYAKLTGADLRLARAVGIQLSAPIPDDCNIFGSAGPRPGVPRAMVSSTSPAVAVALSVHNILASGHEGSAVRLWEAGTGKELRVLHGHENLVMSVAFSPDGARLASAGFDQTVRLWDVATGKELRVLHGHENLVMSVAFSPDGARLASAGYDKTVRLWDVATGKALRVLRGHADLVMSVAFSSDGAHLASASDDKTVRLWDAATGKELRVLHGHENLVISVAFSPDGARLASAGFDQTVRLWDAATGKELRVLRSHKILVRSVAFSPDGAQLAGASDDKTVRLWDSATGKELRALHGHENSVMGVAFSPDGARLASAGYDQTVRLWDAATGKALRVLQGNADSVMSVAFSLGEPRLASAGYDKTVRLWDSATGKALRVLRGHADWVRSVVFSPGGAHVASASDDKTVRLWDAATGKELRVIHGHEDFVSSVAFSPGGAQLASASHDKTVRLWDAATGKELRVLHGHENLVSSVGFSPGGALLASAGYDETVRLWDAATGEELRVLRGHTNWVRSVAFSPAGPQLASASDDKTVRLWDAATGKELRVLHGHESSVRSVAFSPSGAQLASAGDDKTVRLWDAATGKELRVLHGHENRVVISVAFSPDGTRLASVGYDNTVRVWHVKTGDLLATMVITQEGWAVFTPDGRYKVSGNIAGAFWYAINLCRFEPGELDPFLPPGTLRQVALDEPLWSSRQGAAHGS